METLRMLNDGEQAGTEVTWEDQARINAFSRLNFELGEIEEKRTEIEKQHEYAEDVNTELELMDDDEIVMYRIGDAFVHIPAEEAREQLEKTVTKLSQEVSSFDASIDKVKAEMSDLKVKLYAKFGKQINLEVD